MSLKTRLTLSILSLVIAIVLLLSAVYMRSLVSARFEETLERTAAMSLQVQGILTKRVNDEALSRPVPVDAAATRSLWNDIVAGDEQLPEILRDTMSSSRTVVAILVTNSEDRVLASSDPNLTGKPAPILPSFEAWHRNNYWQTLYEVFTRSEDYELSAILGTSKNSPPVFKVNVIVSSVLLRNTMKPQIWNLAIAVGLSFLGAILLAILAARLAFQPLERIGKAIDRIAGGEVVAKEQLAKQQREPAEVAAVQSKLDLLGQQFRGAREDASALQGRIEQLMEGLEEAVLLFDRNDRLIMASRASEAFIAFGRWEMIGRPIDEVLPASTAVGAVAQGALEFKRSIHDHLVTVHRDDSAPLLLLVNVEMLEDFPSRDRMGTMVTLRDAEMRRQIGAQLDVSLRLAAISRLTGGVAHEIKNPLNAITLHLEVLKAKLGQDVAVVAPEINIISSEMARLDRVVKTFLDFTKPVELRLADLDLCEVAREVGALVKPQAARQNVTVAIEAASAAWMRGDRDLLKQAALNIVMNGVDAMKDGGRMTISVGRSGQCCVLSVADQGVGIPPEVREKIFNLYFSTKGGKGSGIGLAVTYRVVQLHGGTIEVLSEPGNGATFRLKFPAIERVLES